MQMGSQSAKTVATGSASANTSGAPETCASPLGTVSLIAQTSAPQPARRGSSNSTQK